MSTLAKQPLEIGFLDVLAWMQCPVGAQAGYRPPHPVGCERVAADILAGYPRVLSPLKEVSAAPMEAARWLLSTRFGASKAPAAPPPALPGKGYWVGLTGYIRLSSTRTLRFELPYLHLVDGAFEIVVLDTHPMPPDLDRHAALTTYMAFLAECFRELTGEEIDVRLVAPGYETETVPELPRQKIVSAVRMMTILEPMAFLHPGTHCNQVVEDGRQHTRWRCPLRDARICQPFGKWTNR